MSVLEFT